MNCDILSLSADSINDTFLKNSQELVLDTSPIDGVAKSTMKQLHEGYQFAKARSDFKAEKEKQDDITHLFPTAVRDEPSTLNLSKDLETIFLQIQPVSKAFSTIDFKTEFDRLRKKTQAMFAEVKEGAQIELLLCNQSCRFDDIFCPLATWVGIGSPEGLYLHANHVTLADATCIATQYPLHIPLFWMLCDKDALIVDLTNQGDMQKGLVSYVPLSKGETLSINGTTINCKDEKTLTFNLKEYRYSGDEGRKEIDARRIHYTGWDDHRGLDDRLSELNQIVDLVEEALSKKQQVIIHCRAGVGRTGTVLVAAALKRLIRQGKVDASNLNQVIDDLVLEGRRQRGPESVQTVAQYRSIWESGKNWLESAIQ